MIEYYKAAFGLNLLFRVHGSAAYRSTIAGALSALFLLLIHYFWENDAEDDGDSDGREIAHPYAIGVLVTTGTFLLVFRLQQAYSRYWEACSAVHHMSSKWMDSVMHTASYHMQCDHFKAIKPPAFFDFPDLNDMYLSRSRERHDFNSSFHMGMETESERVTHRAQSKSIESLGKTKFDPSSLKPKSMHSVRRSSSSNISSRNDDRLDAVSSDDMMEEPFHLLGTPRMDGNWGALYHGKKATFFDPKHPERTSEEGFGSFRGGRLPPLFLQEMAHLCSLLNGVALATLRNDIEGAQSPLDVYNPGAPWPVVDPTKAEDLAFSRGTAMQTILDFIGVSRSPIERTRYNASRPLPVIGGVSDAEIKFLQMARGPYAKTQLCWFWLSEFITREHIAGSTGAVGDPIMSRVMQFLGDGMLYYNHARKVMSIPFPFPHGQLSALYVFVMIPAIALLMDQWTNSLWVGCVLCFLVASFLSGILEVSRELENPFRNVPNELPLVTMQAQFNETLLVMYAGYHPDLFWAEEAEGIRKANRMSDIKEQDDDSFEGLESAPKVKLAQQSGEDPRVKELSDMLKQQGKEIEALKRKLHQDSMAKEL